MSICWYCEKRTADEDNSKRITLCKKLGVTASGRIIRYHYLKQVVLISCCQQCKESFAKINRFVALAVGLSFLAGILLALLVDQIKAGYFGLTEVLVGIVTFALGIALSRHWVKNISVTYTKGKDYRKYPEIAEKLSEGWSEYKGGIPASLDDPD
jgi:hypothetical protein